VVIQHRKERAVHARHTQTDNEEDAVDDNPNDYLCVVSPMNAEGVCRPRSFDVHALGVGDDQDYVCV
jgi:hypothetical protein